MLRVLLLVSFVAAAAAGQDDAIAWSSTRRLTWADFQGKAVNDLDGARSAVNTAMAVGCREGVLQFRVVTQFIPRQSFVTYRITSSGLASRAGIEHEQIHFDLAEVYARRIRKMYTELPAPCPRFDEALGAMADRFLRELASIQRRYETETRSGENGARQADWSKRVAADLTALDAFKDSGSRELAGRQGFEPR